MHSGVTPTHRNQFSHSRKLVLTFLPSNQNPPRPCASRRVDASNPHQILQTSPTSKKPTRGRVYPPPTPSQTVRLAPLQTYPGAGAAPLTFNKCRRNEYNLLMGPFGSDQSRHVDDFGAKNYNFDDFDANTSSFGRLFDEQTGYGHLFIDGRIYL